MTTKMKVPLCQPLLLQASSSASPIAIVEQILTTDSALAQSVWLKFLHEFKKAKTFHRHDVCIDVATVNHTASRIQGPDNFLAAILLERDKLLYELLHLFPGHSQQGFYWFKVWFIDFTAYLSSWSVNLEMFFEH